MFSVRLQSTIALAAILALPFMSGCVPHDSPTMAPEEPEQAFMATVIVEAAEVPLYAAASRTAPVMESLQSGDRLEVIEGDSDWLFVLASSGVRGYLEVLSLVSLECTDDRTEPRPIVTPIFWFSEGHHGRVVLEAEYSSRAQLVSVRVVENTVGDASVEQRAIDDLRGITFLPPTENCEPRAFTYTFTRRF